MASIFNGKNLEICSETMFLMECSIAMNKKQSNATETFQIGFSFKIEVS